jgi:hypothetical protein
MSPSASSSMRRTCGLGAQPDSMACSADWRFMRLCRQDGACGGCSERPRLGNSSLRHTARGRTVTGRRTVLTAHRRLPTILLCRYLPENLAVPDGLRAQCEDLQELIPLNQKTSSERCKPRCSTARSAESPPPRENGSSWCCPPAISMNTCASTAEPLPVRKPNKNAAGCCGPSCLHYVSEALSEETVQRT